MGCIFSTKCSPPIMPTCDGLRETPLRMLGYGTHFGNACNAILSQNRAHIPGMLTTAYVTADIFNKSYKTSSKGDSRKKILVETLDAVIWQSLATMLIPGLIVNRIKKYAMPDTKEQHNCCCSSPPQPLYVKNLPPTVLKALPCIFGVIILPLLMYPIDKCVNVLMDAVCRPLYDDELRQKCSAKQSVSIFESLSF